jgi:predicted aldo/keto reductase-like oxidoreductase
MNSGLKRRDFISQAVSAFGLLHLPRLGKSSPLPQGSVSRAAGEEKPLLTRTLGRTGIRLPIVSMGVMNASVSDVLMDAFQKGVRHFDTAWGYQDGYNERMVGNVIRKLNARKETTLATKVLGPQQRMNLSEVETEERLLAHAHQSLERLQMEQVDILYIHDVSDENLVTQPGFIRGMERLKKEGRIRYTGLSTHMRVEKVVRAATESGFWDVLLVAFNFAMHEDNGLKQALQEAHEKGLGLIAMKTQAGGSWWRSGFQDSPSFQGRLNQKAMLKWVLNHGFFTTAIPGFVNYNELEEDISVATDLNYTEEERKFLSDRDVLVSLGFCRQCGACIPGCPEHVEIPSLMRSAMYAFQYENRLQSRAALETIPAGKGLSRCRDCSFCRVRCPNGVRIGERIAALKSHHPERPGGLFA